MTRYILENGIRREMTDAEEAARDAEELLGQMEQLIEQW